MENGRNWHPLAPAAGVSWAYACPISPTPLIAQPALTNPPVMDTRCTLRHLRGMLLDFARRNWLHTFCPPRPRPLPSQFDSYRESHTMHDDGVKEDIAARDKRIDDLQGKLGALQVTYRKLPSLKNTRAFPRRVVRVRLSVDETDK